MPAHLDYVQVSTRYGVVEISSATHEAILDELRDVEPGPGVLDRLERVDGSEPVELDREAKLAILDAIRVIAEKDGGLHRLDRELFALRNQLLDEVYGRIGE